MGFVWLGMKDPTPEEIATATRAFDVPELAVEEASEVHQRPKLDEHGDHFYGVVKTAWYEDAKEEVHFGEIHVFLGPRLRDHDPARRGRQPAARSPPSGARASEPFRRGPASVVWAILDQVVDDYEPVVGGIDDDIEEVEQAVFEGGPESDAADLLPEARGDRVPPRGGAAAPSAGGDRARRLSADAGRRFGASSARSSGRSRRIDEQINSQRELLTSILEANLSLISVRQNEVVQAISAWAAIIAVPTFFASIWGMNFEHMPELGYRFGYPLALVVMFTATMLLYRFFKRIKWL